MANSNVNIAKKLFAYIQHKADLTQEMVDMYNNSLIFLGDEKQIFVPVMNTYVGVGMSSYNTIIDELNRISSNMSNINSSLNKNTVTRIYSQVDETDNGGIGVVPYYLNNEITIKGIDSYNWANGEAVANEPNSRNVTRNVYVISEENVNGISSTTSVFKEKVNLTDVFAGGSYSGISVTSESAGLYDTGETDDNGNPIYIQGRNVLKIDDSITWAYITAKNAEISDDYKRYTNDEINRIYQTIVGTDKNGDCYIPVSYTQIQLDKDSTAKYYYKTISDEGGPSWSGAMNAATVLGTPWVNEGENVPGDAPQFYMRVVGDNAYNLGDKDIRNGLNTLKEVAYVLDVLTDGMEGDVTYVTKTAYEADRENHPEREYHLVTENSGPENYAYYATLNSDNLGIKMAYSIYGNQVQIDELRDHIKAIESGDTTLRSIDSDTNSQYASLEISTQDNHHGAIDFNAGKPFTNENVIQGTSNVAYFGDATVKLNLNTTEVYVKTTVAPQIGVAGTSNEVVYLSSDAVVLNGVKTIGLYQKADKNNLDTANIDYYSAVEANNRITLTKLSASEATNATGELYFVDPSSVQGDTVLYEWSKDNKSDVYILNHVDKIYGSKGVNDVWTIYPNAQAAAAAAAGDANTDPVNVYQVTDETATLTAKLFAKVPAEGVESDKIATSAWVLSLVGDVSDNPSSGGGTAEEIDLSSLKYEHEYGDFDSLYWNTSNATGVKAGLTEGTAAYQAKYDEYYDVFKNGGVTESGNNVVLSKDGKTITLTKEAYYASNRFNKASKVLDIVNQENGKVSATSRELPSDEIVAKANIWGEEESSNPKEYTPLPVEDSIFTSGDNIINNLFAFRKASESEIFIKFGTTYKEIPTNIEQGNFPDGDKYWYNTATNTYSQLTGGLNENEPYSSWEDYTTKQGWLRWRPIYVATDKYVNLDLNSAAIENGVLHLKDVAGNDYPITSETTLYYANVKPANEVKYLTTESKHFDYAHGGTGENRLEVTANIVKLEDASVTNTGFADAFDVKSYIDNLIEWVNLSASVSNADLANPVFYEVVPTSVTVTEANYKKVVNGNTVTMETLGPEDVAAANGSTSSWKANGRWITGHEVYTRVQNVVENPLNLTTTKLVTAQNQGN